MPFLANYTDTSGGFTSSAYWVVGTINLDSRQKVGQFYIWVYVDEATFLANPSNFLLGSPILFSINNPVTFATLFTPNLVPGGNLLAALEGYAIGKTGTYNGGISGSPANVPAATVLSTVDILSAEVGLETSTLLRVTYTGLLTGGFSTDGILVTVNGSGNAVTGWVFSNGNLTTDLTLTSPVVTSDVVAFSLIPITPPFPNLLRDSVNAAIFILSPRPVSNYEGSMLRFNDAANSIHLSTVL